MRSRISKMGWQFITKPGPLALLAFVVIFFGVTQHYSRPAKAQTPHPRANVVAWQTLKPAQHVPTNYQGRAETVAKLQSGAAPLAMASADFDGDGIADLVVGFAHSSGGILTVHRGNLDAFAPQSHASWLAIGHNQFPAPFLPQATVIDVPEAPQFIVTGDFSGNGDVGILTGASGSQHLYLFAGNGKGKFSAPQTINLPGALTALAAGHVGVRDGKTDVVAGVQTAQAAAVLVYKGSAGGLSQAAVSYPVPQPATQLEIGDLHGDGFPDVAVLAGAEVLIIHPTHPTGQAGEDTSKLIERVPTSGARSIAVGGFVWERKSRNQLAVLSQSGIVQVLSSEELDTRPFTKEEMRIRRTPALRAKLPSEMNSPWAGESHPWNVVRSGAVSAPMSANVRLMAAGLAHTRPVDLMVVDPSDSRLHVLSANTSGDSADETSEMTVETGDAPAAVLPMRVNVDGRRGLLMVGRSGPQPKTMAPLPDPTYTVNRSDDPTALVANASTYCNGVANDCSFRQAVIKANSVGGTDTIMLPAGTITLTITGQGEGAAETGDVDVTDSVNIIGEVAGNGNPTSIITGATGWNDKFISVNKEGTSDANLSVSNVIFQNGNNTNLAATESGFDALGGAVAFYGCATEGGGCTVGSGSSTLSITNVQFLNNSIGNSTLNGCSGGNNADCGGGLLSQFGDTTITSSTFTGNVATNGRGGALVLQGAVEAMTVSNSKFTSNTSGIEGGAIDIDFQNGYATGNNIAIHSSTISSNTAGTYEAADGGGLYVNLGNGSAGPGTTKAATIDQETVISDNSAQRGGGIDFEGTSGPSPNNTSLTISKVTITGNAATGSGADGGGGIFVPDAGTLNIQYSRIAGNTSAHSGTPTGISIEPVGATIHAADNWWGCNTGPSAAPCDTVGIIGGTGATLTDTPYIILSLGASPTTLQPQPPGQTSSTLTADFLHEASPSQSIALGNIDVLLGLPITFGATHGTISGAQTTIQSNGEATANVAPDTSCGTPLVASATVDTNPPPTVTTSITVDCPDLTASKSNSLGSSGVTTPLSSNTWTWMVTVSNSSGGTSAPAEFSSGQTILTDHLPSSGITYGTPTVGGQSGLTNGGNISCGIASNVLTCTASGAAVTIGNPGSFQVSIPVTNAAAGSYSNPTGGSCAVDPNNDVIESNESNNGCGSNTVTVVAPPTISKAFGTSQIPIGGTTTLTFTLTNPSANTVAETGVAFTDPLPPGLTVGNSTASQCGGTLTTTAPSTITLSGAGATIATSSQCQFSVTVTGAASGQYTNTTEAVTSTNGGTGSTASANLTVASPPTITKSFSPTTIPLNGVSTLSLTLTNPNASVTLTGVNFSDNFPSGLQVANPAGIGSTCSGTWNATPGDTFLNFGGGTLPSGSSCSLTVNVTSTQAGVINNATNAPVCNEAGTGVASNTASLIVIAPPGISKAFELVSQIAASPTGATESGPTVTIATTSQHGFLTGQSVTIAGVGVAGYNGIFTIASVPTPTTFTYTDTTGLAASGGGMATVPITTMPLNGTATLAFTLTNPNSGTALSGVSFSDALPSGLQVAATPNASAPCGTFAPNAGDTTLSFSSGTLPVSGQCIVSVNITGTTPGVKNNTTGNVTSTEGGTGGTASASLAVLSPPSISKTFGAANLPTGGTTTLTFTITNPNAANQLTGVDFTDALPSGLAVASTPGASTSCGGTFAPNAGDTTLTFSGGTIAAAGTCTISVNITGTTPGVKNNTTGNVTSTNGGTGNTASASLTVAAPPTITKAFGASSILLNGTTSLTFTITNPNASLGLTSVSFTDTLPAGLTVPNATTTQCSGGTLTTSASAGTITLTGATITASGSCSFGVTVTGATAGVWNNTTGAIASNESGAGATSNTATLTVVGPPTISKSFDAATIPLNGTSVLTFTITNNNTTTTLTGIGFSDTLPAGLTVASGTSSTCGGGTLTATAPATIALTGASVAPSSNCTFSVTVTGATAGVKNNTTGAITSANGGTGTTSNTASITVVAPPSIAKVFGAANVALNGTTSLTFTLTNPNGTVALTGVGFTDTLPPGLVVSTPNGLTGSCVGGTTTATAGGGTISLAGASLGTSANCIFSVNVTGTSAGIKNNSVTVSSTNGGTGNTSTASIAVALPPSISKTFGASSIPLNGSTSLSFTITNPNASVALAGVAFTDSLPAGLVVETPNGVSGTCGGTVTAVGGSGSVSLSGGTLADSASCTISVNVTGTSAGGENNSVTVTSTTAGTGNTATASMTVVAPPTISKAFGAASIPLNGSTSLGFTVSNPNATTTLTGIGFSDTLPTGLVISTPNGESGTCGGTITATAGTNLIKLSGASLAASGSCNFSVNVIGSTAGAKNNTTGAITSTNGGTGLTASASLAVEAPPTISKAFGAPSILLAGSTTLTFTLTNPAVNPAAEAGVAFADTLPAGLVVATPNGLTNGCGGTATATAGGSSISLTGGSIATNTNCTVVVNVTSTTTGVKNNTTGAVSSANGGTGTTSNTATLTIDQPPHVTSLNYATFTKGVMGTFTVTTTGYPVPSLTFSPAGSLPAGVTFVDNHNGTATLSGKPTVSGTFTFWIEATNGVSPPALESFTLTVH